MKIVRPYARLMTPPVEHLWGDSAMRQIEWCARISHRAEDAQKGDSWKRFIQSVVIDHGDWSVVEHVTASVDMLVDRGITHELVRHRLFSFTQESTRFVNYEKKMAPSFIYPVVDIECALCLSLSGNDPLRRPEDGHECVYNPHWLTGIRHAELAYQDLIRIGWRPQEARSVFPNALASRIIVTGNLRNWRHLFIMRSTVEAHPQMRQVVIPLLAEFKATFPILFDDIEPGARQVENLRKPR